MNKQAAIAIATTIVAILLAVALAVAHQVGGGANQIGVNDHAAAIMIAITLCVLVVCMVAETVEIVVPVVGFFAFLSGFALLYLRVWATFEDRAWLQSDAALWTIRISVESGAAVLLGYSIYRLLTRPFSAGRTAKRFALFAVAAIVFYTLLYALNGGTP